MLMGGRHQLDPYVNENLGLAVLFLAIGTGSIQDRLADIFVHLLPLTEKDFSDENLSSNFSQIYIKR